MNGNEKGESGQAEGRRGENELGLSSHQKGNHHLWLVVHVF